MTYYYMTYISFAFVFCVYQSVCLSFHAVSHYPRFLHVVWVSPSTVVPRSHTSYMLLVSKKEEAKVARSIKSYAWSCTVSLVLYSIGQSSQRAFLDSWEGEDTLYFLVEGLQGHIAEAHVG